MGILPKQSFGTTRSTLNVVPGRLGALPEVVKRQQLCERIRSAVVKHMISADLALDQLYVNHYSALAKGRIGFHHDHPATMGGVIAGLSLGSSCEFHLLALDQEFSCQPSLAIQI